MVSKKATSCPHCGRILKKPPRQYGCCGLIVLGSVLALGFVIVSSAIFPNRQQLQRPRVATPPGPALLVAGDVASLDDGDTVCTLAVDDAAWDLMIAIQNAKGDMMPLVRDGRVFLAKRRTKVRIIKSTFTSYQVQMLEGPYQGSIGWIQKEFARAN